MGNLYYLHYKRELRQLKCNLSLRRRALDDLAGINFMLINFVLFRVAAVKIRKGNFRKMQTFQEILKTKT